MYKVRPIYDDIRLFFDEPSHKYTDNLGNEYVSTTTLLHNYKPKFDKEYWLNKKAKELHISKERLAKQWQEITDEACKRGTKTHNGLEDSIKDTSMFYKAVQHIKRNDNSMTTVADIETIDQYAKPIILDDFIQKTENKYPKIYEIFDYYITNGYKIYSEIGSFIPDLLISGTIDILILREDKFIIGDWKTNRGGLKFESGYYKKDKRQNPHQTTDVWVSTNNKLLPPVAHLADCNGAIYNLQLSMYAFMVEYILGLPCAGLWLCHIDSDFVLNEYGMPKRFPDGLYHLKKNPKEIVTVHKMKYLRTEIINILEDRRKNIAASRIASKTLF